MQNEIITFKNREFTITDKTPITNYPTLAANQPNVEYCFIAQGKRGSTITGYITKSGKLIVF